MQLLDVVRRSQSPQPWSEGEKIPWHERAFSERMLAEHLSQAHDAASRRAATIERHVHWIHRSVLGERATRILDLGCGPGLYTQRLARLGHRCTGIDFAPAALDHARREAARDGLDCDYRLEDLRVADLGAGFGLVMLIHGELNTFRRIETASIAARARAALERGGVLLLEVYPYNAVESRGRRGPTWYAAERGLFGAEPHLCLSESFWNAERSAATERWFVIDAATGTVTRQAASMQAYTDDELDSLLLGAGFKDLEQRDSLTEEPDRQAPDLRVVIARAT